MHIKKLALILTLSIFTLLFFILEIHALRIESQWALDNVALIVLLWALYFLRNKLNLHPLHYFLFAIFLAMHDLGMFGAYVAKPLGIEFDFYPHIYFGFVAALILFRTYRRTNVKQHIYLILITILALSAVHEIFEYGAAITFGKGEGVFFIGAGDDDPFDTQKDMLNGLVGGIAGLALYWSYLYVAHHHKRKTS